MAKTTKVKKSTDPNVTGPDSVAAHRDALEELSKRVHAAMVDLSLADDDDPPPGCHWEFEITPNGVKRKLVC